MDQFVREPTGRDDFHALDGLAEVRAEIAFVAGQEMSGVAGDCAAEDRNVFRLQLDIELAGQRGDLLSGPSP